MNTYNREQTAELTLVGRMVAREGKRDELLQLLGEAIAVCGEREPGRALSATFHVRRPTRTRSLFTVKDGHQSQGRNLGPTPRGHRRELKCPN